MMGAAGERLAVESEQPVDGAGLAAGELLEPLGRLAGRCGQDDFEVLLRVDLPQRRNGVGFAAPRSPADQRDGVRESGQDGLALPRMERGSKLLDPIGQVLRLGEMRVGRVALGERLGQILLHPANERPGHQETAAVGRAGERAFIDECAECGLDLIPAVERVHDEQGVGLLDQLLELHPAIAPIERHRNAVENAGADAGRIVLGCPHPAGNLVDPLEAEASDFPNDEIGIGLEQAQGIVAEPIDQTRDLMVREAVGCQLSQRPVDLSGLLPFLPQPLDRRQGQLRSLGNGLRLFDNGPVEIFAEAFGDPFRLDRSDPLDVRMVSQVVGQAFPVQFQVVDHAVNFQLLSVLGMGDPAALENDLVPLAGEELTGEGHDIAIDRHEPARGELRGGVVDGLNPAANLGDFCA